MSEKKYSKDHEWLEFEGDVATIGITNHAQESLGDIVFIDLPEIGKKTSSGDEVSVIESVKAASDIYSPLDGEIIEVNEMLSQDATLINKNAEDEGWIFKLKISDLRITTYRDSIESPEFYIKYSEKQAYSDFKNGKKRILANDEFHSKESSERRKKLSKQYGFEYDYIFDSQTTIYKYRIMTRYNEIMKKLIGIKNVW